MSLPPKPRRRFQATISVGADTPDGLKEAAQEVADAVAEGGRGGAAGGVTSGWHYAVEEDPEMTSKKYHEALAAYLVAKAGGET